MSSISLRYIEATAVAVATEMPQFVVTRSENAEATKEAHERIYKRRE